MTKRVRTNNPALRSLIDFWKQYCELEKWHVEWVRQHLYIHPSLGRNSILYLHGERQQHVYFVTSGLLARIQVDPESGKRKILSVALPGMAMMTRAHLYSSTPSHGDIVVLRSKSVVVSIPFQSIIHVKEKEPCIDTLIDVLGNKKKKQLGALRLITHSGKPFESYLNFVKELPELSYVLTNQEAADLLGISVQTVYRTKRFLLNR